MCVAVRKKKGREEDKRETNKNETTDRQGARKADAEAEKHWNKRKGKEKRTSQCAQHQEAPITNIIKSAWVLSDESN